MLQVECYSCGHISTDFTDYYCSKCEGIIGVHYEKMDKHEQWIDERQPGIWRYARLLPKIEEPYRGSIGEGRTALVRSRSIAEQLGLKHLYFKMESANPTGSYKDRIAAIGVSWAAAHHRQGCIGTTSGNAGAAVAAYAARLGMPYRLLVLEQMAEAKLAQLLIYGADVTKIQGFGTQAAIGDRVFQWIQEQAEEHALEMMVTAFRFSPYAMEGVKTISFEICEQLPEAPHRVYAPAGGGGLFCGIWKGFKELHEFGFTSHLPLTVAAQPEGCSNIVRAYSAGSDQPLPGDATTRISGLQVPNPPDGELALRIMRSGEGSGVSVSDEDILHAQWLLGRQEGIFCEPAGATALAGLIRARENGQVKDDEVIVCCVSGSGFKDYIRMIEMAEVGDVPLLSIDQL